MNEPEEHEVDRVSDEELDLVETTRLIDALGRRQECLIVSGLRQPIGQQWEITNIFLPNAIACSGLLDLTNTAMGVRMRLAECQIARTVRGKTE